MIPALNHAEFLRYGVMHRNTFINSPKLLNSFYQTVKNEKIFFAGQITGVEGYVESASSGLAAGINMSRLIDGREMIRFPKETSMGGLSLYISENSVGDFQPMNITFGLMSPLGRKVKGKKEKNTAIAQRAIEIIKNISHEINS